MYHGIDCAAKLTEVTAAAIREAGYDFVGRYLVPPMGVLARKALAKEECEAISRAGLKILAVFEKTAECTKGGAAAGTQDGREAYVLAEEYEIPRGAILYFAVDYDAPAAEFDTIEAYLRAARAQTGDYEIGVYGSYGVVEAMYQRRACRGFWQSKAWSYGNLSEHYSVYQYKMATVAGLDMDINKCPDMTGAGMWDYQEEKMTLEKFMELYQQMRKLWQNNDASAYSEAARNWAVSEGLIKGGGTLPDGKSNYMWEELITREQLVTVLSRFRELLHAEDEKKL